MGIKKFMSWLNENYSNCIITKQSNVYDDIYIDMNFIIHLYYYSATSENALKIKILEYIKNIASSYNILKHLYLYFDGGSGEIKKNTTIKRIKTSHTNSLISSKIFSHKSKFMTDLNNMLSNINNNKLCLNDNVQIIINGNNIFGEAEYKIINTVINNKTNKSLIISNDSDMILISIASNINDIYILNNHKIYSIDIIKKTFTDTYNTSYMDFIILSLFQGNDYFPKLKFVTFKSTWNAYKLYIESSINKNKSLYNGTSINMFNLRRYINYLLYCLPKQYNKFVLNNNFIKEIYNKDVYLKYISYCIDLYKSGDYSNTFLQSYTLQPIYPGIFLFK